jgi:hypothetical protein
VTPVNCAKDIIGNDIYASTYIVIPYYIPTNITTKTFHWNTVLLTKRSVLNIAIL